MYKHSYLGLMVFLTGPGSISRVPHDSDEFSKVVEKFRKDWAWEKRPYPAVNFIFKVTNNMLEQKWMAYKRTVREKDVKELYHGTKLSCKITTTWKLLCDMLPGRKYVVQTNRQHLQGPPTGYDSVYGNVGKDLNYPELVVYNPDAVLPRYIIIYRSRED